MSTETPMVRQYKKIKLEHPDAILFFRLGDFYEMFYEDAKTASKVLGITLTSRNKSDTNPIPLCGVPFHSAEPYLAKLLEHGHKVAICEQIEDPKLARGIVERKVVKILTPGVIVDTEHLEDKTNNYLTCIAKYGEHRAIATADISTGELRAGTFSSAETLKSELTNLQPKEILIPCDTDGYDFINDLSNDIWKPVITKKEEYLWELQSCDELLKNYLGVKTLQAFNLENKPDCIVALGVLINYLLSTQIDDMPPLKNPVFYDRNNFLQIDGTTMSNLEILRTIRGDTKSGTLLSVIDMTLCAMGARLLRQWINYPLTDSVKINKRLQRVDVLSKDPALKRNLRASLKEISDIERIITRISTNSAKPRDLGAIRDSIVFIKEIKNVLIDSNILELGELEQKLDSLQDIYEIISESIVSEPPNTLRTPPVIKEGFNKELDSLRSLTKDGKKWIAELEAKEKEATGINFLKIGYNKVFGYYIEVTKANIHLVPESYIRKQTLVNAERFITPDLKEQEEKIVGAEEKVLDLERTLFEQIRKQVEAHSHRIRKTSAVIAEIDVLCGLSETAERNSYVKPEINNSDIIDLHGSRHPVIESIITDERFVPNDIKFDCKENQLLLITGPNMAEKSTLIRQAALCVLMAQIGSFVPAKSASIGVVDKIFTRVGASDNLSKGQSTFMVEMVETAYILRNATDKSLVILDEIGRGTSTFDGMSIAWSVAEFLHDLGCKTLFATHYHELAELSKDKERVKNYNVCVKESDDKIVFLRKLIEGAASHSYGIEVAKLAGIPGEVISSAKKVLYNLEKTQSDIKSSISEDQLKLFNNKQEDKKETELIDQLKSLDLDNMTPMQALSKIAELKEKLKET
ncbi:MAG TPA: DNA mismatch repair protein MutS [Thermodesulfobacteriota bacterium]|nr:DNA mismatch repair protein MutS [Thermodesulfobacteriota bacterium]